MSSLLARGSEAEFLQQLLGWRPCHTIIRTHGQTTPAKKKSKPGPGNRASSNVTAPSSNDEEDSSAPSKYFVLLESTPRTSIDHRSPSLRLVASNILSVWLCELDLSTFRRHRESLGIATVGWKEMLEMVRTCFDTNRVNVTTDEETTRLILTCRYNIGSEVELEGRFTLNQVEEDTFPSSTTAAASSSSSHLTLNASQQLLSHLLFHVFTPRAPTSDSTSALQVQINNLKSEQANLQAEIASLRTINTALQNERATWSSSGGSSGFGHSQQGSSFDSSDPTRSPQSSTAGPSAGAKRKAPTAKPKNMSILNPNAKRKKVGSIKIE